MKQLFQTTRQQLLLLLLLTCAAALPASALDELSAARVHSTLANASKCIRADELYPGGKLGLSLDGSGMTLHICELIPPVLTTHEAFRSGLASGSRVTNFGNVPAAPTDEHLTNVTAVAVADGTYVTNAVRDQIRGVAYKAAAYVQGDPEAVSLVFPGHPDILVSNHSYGLRELVWAGAYIPEAAMGDSLTYANKYWLMVGAAGNFGDEQNRLPLVPNSYQSPVSGIRAGYDVLAGGIVEGKNILAVGAVSGVTYDADGNVTEAKISSFSGRGPTDDFRIKPEIMALGEDLYLPSTNQPLNKGYIYGDDGTSYAAPAVSGACLLLQQHHKRTYGAYMRAATLRALVLHTANVKAFNKGAYSGPNVRRGYGLMDAMAAARVISQKYVSSWIEEAGIGPGAPTKTYTFRSTGQPFKVSLCWTDTAARPSYQANNTNPVLINDLDLRVTDGTTTYYPWAISAAYPIEAYQGDNNRDPYEQVFIESPGNKTYTITISCKRNAFYANRDQDFSLIVTGLADGDVCNATASINYPVTDSGKISAGQIHIAAAVQSPPGKSLRLSAAQEIILAPGGQMGPNTAIAVAPCAAAAGRGTAGSAGSPASATTTDPDGMGDDPIRLYPNPASGRITIRSADPVRQVRMMHIDGKAAGTFPNGTLSPEFTIDISALPAAVYLAEIITVSGRREVRKVVRQR